MQKAIGSISNLFLLFFKCKILNIRIANGNIYCIDNNINPKSNNIKVKIASSKLDSV